MTHPVRRIGLEVLALAYAVSGPLAMRWAGFAAPVPVTVGAALLAVVALALLPRHRWWPRAIVVAVAMVLVAGAGSA